MGRDQVKRNIVALCTVPRGSAGRRSKALTMAEAEAVLRASEGTRMHSYIVLSLLTGARTEELRALTWDDISLRGDPDATPGATLCGRVPIGAGWRRHKTRKSRRTLALSKRCVFALETSARAATPGAGGCPAALA